MLKHCCNSSVTILTFKGQHGRRSPGAAGLGALGSVNVSVSICLPLQLCAQPTPNCICTLLYNSLLWPGLRVWSRESVCCGLLGRSLILGHSGEFCTVVVCVTWLCCQGAESSALTLLKNNWILVGRMVPFIRIQGSNMLCMMPSAAAAQTRITFSSQPPGKVIPGFERQCNVFLRG